MHFERGRARWSALWSAFWKWHETWSNKGFGDSALFLHIAISLESRLKHRKSFRFIPNSFAWPNPDWKLDYSLFEWPSVPSNTGFRYTPFHLNIVISREFRLKIRNWTPPYPLFEWPGAPLNKVLGDASFNLDIAFPGEFRLKIWTSPLLILLMLTHGVPNHDPPSNMAATLLPP